ncbi:putative isomerase YbhE [Thozetella sp. PMI_491]|nr:putative isomerase YbhE [Thozetella sp. PMI_491]
MKPASFFLTPNLIGEGVVNATSLYVASYAGPVFHLAFTYYGDKSYALEEIGLTLDCGFNPAWLELDEASRTLYCANEAYASSWPPPPKHLGMSANASQTLPESGSIAAFDKATLSSLDNLTTDYGPAQSLFFAPNRLGLAHYAGGAVSVLDTSNPSHLVELQSFHYTMAVSGPNVTLQDKPYPHGLAVDPTGKYVVVLDRGADALRLYTVGWDGRLEELGVYLTEPGNGPRHGVFIRGTERTFFYMLGELTNSLHGFEVLYSGDSRGINFRQFCNDLTYQTGFGDASEVALPSEIAVADGGRHLLVSVRNDSRQRYAGEASDTIATYAVELETGALKLVNLAASGGAWPRSFAITKDGRAIAVGNQYIVPGRLVVFARDPETGVIDDQQALATWTTDIALLDGQSISNVLWDE